MPNTVEKVGSTLDAYFRLVFQRNEGQLFKDFIAFTVQHPKEKIHQALIIEGARGGGKTFLANLIGSALGERVTLLHSPSDRIAELSGRRLFQKHGFIRNEEGMILFFYDDVWDTKHKGKKFLENTLKPMLDPRIPNNFICLTSVGLSKGLQLNKGFRPYGPSNETFYNYIQIKPPDNGPYWRNRPFISLDFGDEYLEYFMAHKISNQFKRINAQFKPQ